MNPVTVKFIVGLPHPALPLILKVTVLYVVVIGATIVPQVELTVGELNWLYVLREGDIVIVTLVADAPR